MKIEITQNRTIFGKKTKTFTAKFAEWIGEGKTKEEALAGLTKILENQNKYLFERKYIPARNAVFALYYAQGFCYDIVHTDTGQVSTCMMGDIPKLEAIEKMTAHALTYGI